MNSAINLEHKTTAFAGLNDQATSLLRDRILSGALSPGDRIVELDLASEFGVSRGTIRAALQQLAFEGLIVQHRFRSTFVASLTSHDAYEIYTLRNALEAMAARLAAARMDDAGRDALAGVLETMQGAAHAGDRSGVIDADYAIHRRIVDLAGHGRLSGQYQLIESQTRIYLSITATLDYDLGAIIDIHRDLVEAVSRGDAKRAETLARNHNTPDGKRMVALLKQQEDNAR